MRLRGYGREVMRALHVGNEHGTVGEKGSADDDMAQKAEEDRNL